MKSCGFNCSGHRILLCFLILLEPGSPSFCRLKKTGCERWKRNVKKNEKVLGAFRISPFLWAGLHPTRQLLEPGPPEGLPTGPG